MKKTTTFLSMFLLAGFASVKAQNVSIPDANFKAYLVGNSEINTNGDTEISLLEAQAFTGTIDCGEMEILDLTGIEAFVSLTKLYCHNNLLTSLDVSQNTALTFLTCSNNVNLTTLDVSANTFLELLACENNNLTTLDVSNNLVLRTLYCSVNNLTSLDVSVNVNLENLRCYVNQITTIDVSNNVNLIDLRLYSNELTTLDVSNNTNLEYLYVADNQIEDLDISNNMQLIELDCGNNQISNLYIDDHVKLELLRCNDNDIMMLDLKKLVNLRIFHCQNNQMLTFIWMDNNMTELVDFRCQNGFIEGRFDFTNSKKLSNLVCYNNRIEGLNVTGLTELTNFRCQYNDLGLHPYFPEGGILDLSSATNLVAFTCNGNDLTSLNLKNGNNTNLTLLNLTGNSNLYCIQVDDVVYSNTNWADKKDASACYNESCLTPAFADVPMYACKNSSLTLPTTSDNGVTGTWTPDTVDTSTAAGGGYYTFTPTSCNGNYFNKLIFVVETGTQVYLSFNIPEICQNSVFHLPTISLEGVVGTWNVPTVDTSQAITQDYTFTPGGNECIVPKIVSIEVKENTLQAPTGDTQQYFTTGQTLADLVVSGTNLVWYLDANLTISFPETKKLIHNTTYYVVNQDNQCRSFALAITALDCAEFVTIPEGEENQTFTAGQTIADLVVNGSNLVWYSDEFFTDLLSDSDILVEGIYYVINQVGVCQSEALIINVTQVAGRTDFDLYGFRYHPNPVNDILHFSSNSKIEKVTISNMLGQTINANLNSDNTSLDMSNLAIGNYFVKVTIEGVSKTIKVIKN